MPDAPPPRFYGRRKGRTLRPNTQAALEGCLEALQFNPEEKAFLGPASRELWMEIGFGSGEHLMAQLCASPDVHILGCEAYQNGVAHLVKTLNPKDYSRVRVFPDDVRLCLETIAPNTFSRIFILFPDPWPKKRHAKRRLIQPAFLDQLADVLQPKGQLRFASDDGNYVAWVQEMLAQHPNFEPIQQETASSPETWPTDWPRTRYGNKALAQGKSCTFLVYERC